MAIARNNNLSKSAKFFDSDGALNLVQGSNITITKNASAGTITIASTASGGGEIYADSAWVQSLPVSTFTNDANYLDSTTVQSVIDGTYIQNNQIKYNTADFPDSAGVIALISANETTYTNVSEFTNDANYLDSTTVQGVIDQTYIRDNQIKYNTSDFVDSAYVTTQINNLIGSAPGTLDTLEEIANALNNDSNAYGSLVALINGMADSAWVQSLDVSTFTNDANYLDSTTVQGVIDSAYVNARVAAGTDSAAVVTIIGETVDSAYIILRETPQDFAYSSLTGAPNVLDSADVITLITANDQQRDSAFVTNIIDSAYVQVRQDYAYNSLTGAPTNISTFTNDANYLDSTTVQGVINSTYVQNNQITYNTSDFVDSAGVNTIVDAKVGVTILAHDSNLQSFVDTFTLPTTDGSTNHVLLTNGTGTLSFASVASVSGATDSGDVRNLIDEVVDSTFVALHQVPQDFAYSSLSGAPTNVSSFTNDANYLDSITVQGVITQSYIRNNQITYNTSDFVDSAYVSTQINNLIGSAPGTLDTLGEIANALNNDSNAYGSLVALINGMADSAWVQSLPISTFTNDANYLDSTTVQGVINSSYIQANQTTYTNVSEFVNDANYLDSITVISVIDSAYVAARTSAGTDSATVVSIIGDTVDSAYVQARQTAGGGGLDSAAVLALTGLSSVSTSGVTTYEYTATASQQTFSGIDDNSATLAYTAGNILVHRNGILLVSTVDYTATNGTSINLQAGADSGDTISITAWLPTLVNTTETTITSTVEEADSGQTSFTISHTEDQILVFLNGILLKDSDDYTSNGSTIVLTSAANSGDQLTVHNFGKYLPVGTIEAVVDSDYVQARQIPANNVDLTNYHYVATADQTSFSGNDIAGNSLSYTTSNIQVFKNGILLIDSDDYTATSGNSIILSSGARVGDTISISNYGQSAGSLNLRDSGSGIAVTAALSVEGAMYVNGSVETLIDKSSATGTVTHNFNDGALFYHSSISSNFTVNLTNLPTTNGKAIVVSLILDQGATAYIPNALQVGGVAQTINWFGGSTPSGNANKKDLVAFTLIRRSGSWTVLGQLSSFG